MVLHICGNDNGRDVPGRWIHLKYLTENDIINLSNQSTYNQLNNWIN